MNVTYNIVIFPFIFHRLQYFFVAELKQNSMYSHICLFMQCVIQMLGPLLCNKKFTSWSVVSQLHIPGWEGFTLRSSLCPSRLGCVIWSSYLVIHLCSCYTQICISLTLHQLVEFLFY